MSARNKEKKKKQKKKKTKAQFEMELYNNAMSVFFSIVCYLHLLY